eukprot:jgi/Mesvir1/11693/Mv00085-RA.1
MCWPRPGRKVLAPEVKEVHIVTFVNICAVFFISGLQLRTDELKAALSRKTIAGTAFGLVSIVGITPLLGFVIRELPMKPGVFITGMTIFTLVPTTLGVGISLTQSAGGNVGLAIVNTLFSNVCGVVLVPLWLKAMLSTTSSAGVEDLNISIGLILVKLILSNFVPTLLGKLLRDFSNPVQAFVKKNRVRLSLFSNTNLAFLIWQTLSGARDDLIHQEFGTMLLVIAMDLIVHVLYLLFNTAGVFLLRMPLQEGIATIITASQKSAPVAVTVINYITSNPTNQGLLAVPCIIGQLVQIFVGQPLANYMASLVKESQQNKDLKASKADDKRAPAKELPVAQIAKEPSVNKGSSILMPLTSELVKLDGSTLESHAGPESRYDVGKHAVAEPAVDTSSVSREGTTEPVDVVVKDLK